MGRPSLPELRARCTSGWLSLAALVALALAASAAISTRFGTLADYPADAQPAVDALSHGDLHGALSHPALMGVVSIVVRAPFVALIRLGGAGELGSYRVGAAVCVAAVGLLGVGLMLSTRGASRPRMFRALGVLLAVVNPVTVAAVQWGHPEEALTAALCVAAVALAFRDRSLVAAIALGLAIATKQWAILAIGPAILATPTGRRLRLAAAAGCVAAVFTLPVIIGNPGGFLRISHSAAAAGALTTRSTWWFLVAKRVHLHLRHAASFPSELTIYHVPLWLGHLTHPLIVVSAIPLTALVYWRNRSRSAALPLLSLLFLLRCVLDPLDNAYYHLPLFLSLLAWETLTPRRSVPFVTLLTAVALWLTFDVVEPTASAQTTNLVYVSWTGLLALYLLRELRPRASKAPAMSCSTEDERSPRPGIPVLPVRS
jgi:hypothetical protein